MSIEFTPAKRENVPLLIGLAGGTGSGKTYSAMKLATGLAGGKPFAVIDTERGRAKHYADDFKFDHAELNAPFCPDRYAAAIEAAANKHYGVIVVDSMSHEYAGDGGVVEMHDAEVERLVGKFGGTPEKWNWPAWNQPKQDHKKMLTRLLQVPAHVILCFRAEQKLEQKKVGNKTELVPKSGLNIVDGWVMLTEKNLPYELTMSLLLRAEHPGVPHAIKLQEQHHSLVPLDQPISETTGVGLAEWARGGTSSERGKTAARSASRSEGASVEALTPEKFKALCDGASISAQAIRAAGRKLFPGRSSKDLINEERAQLWTELQAKEAA